MTEHRDDLPPELSAKLMTFLRETNGEFEVADMTSLVNFIAEYGEQHPILLSLVNVNEDAVVEHFKKTGEVPPGIKIMFPSQGWKQILTARKEMLDIYDRAREQARSHEVETYHGKVAEAACRKWLGGFLPKRYGVTSGYVVSAGLSSGDKAPHFDVIIYDQLESPILWIEDNPDSSSQGRSLAIPVEYVRAILEVKASFSAKTVRDSLAHLRDLSPLLRHVDAPTERYKRHLPPTFCCGSVFFELRQIEANSEAALSALICGVGLKGYFGGVILRGEGHTLPQTARLSLTQSEAPIESMHRSGATSLLEFGMSKSVQLDDNVHIESKLMWSESGFAQFAFDLIAMIQGTYKVGRLSSLYGIGGAWPS